jgi:hypothetical protein
MEPVYQTARIGKRTLRYRRISNQQRYEFSLPHGIFGFQAWNWEAKNRVFDACISFDASLQEFRLNVPQFNEMLLMTTMKSARLDGKEAHIDLTMIRNLNAALGDLLLEICRWVNHLDGQGPQDADAMLNNIQRSAQNGVQVIKAGDYTFTLQPWTWGEKNRIVGECATAEEDGKQVRLSTRKFNEQMLLATLKSATFRGRELDVTTQFLQGLDARLGDALLEGAHEINEITWDEKKN